MTASIDLNLEFDIPECAPKPALANQD